VQRPARFLVFVFLATVAFMTSQASAETRIIAHRGASAHLPEHTMAAYLLAYGQGVDFLEPDLVLSRDGVLFALHDLTLNATTNVASVFPDRARDDGLHYAIDFTADELDRFDVNERIEPDTGQARYPDRWPVGQGEFGLVRFEALVDTVRSLNRSTGRRVGLYPEIKSPSFHRAEGQDIARILVAALDRHDLPSDDLPVWIQCFEADTLRALRLEHGDRYTLVQLIGENAWGEFDGIDWEQSWTPDGLDAIAEYADGIGPPFARLIEASADGAVASEAFQQARARGLVIHPFTFRRESMPPGIALEALLALFMNDLRVEALFTDHPGVAVDLRARSRGTPSSEEG
jgi:glycerophosphoryl diester phosphodiesterase